LRKVPIILFILLMNGGCSVFRNQETRNTALADNTNISNLSERIKNHNISADNFFIEKAQIQVSGPDGDQKFLGSLKFEIPDKYLISLKSTTGIEAMRIYISGDTILINDRFNKKLYIGNSQYIRRKYGVPVSLLPLILGDFFATDLNDRLELKCNEGKLDLNEGQSGLMIKYVIDCNKAKVVSIGVENSLNQAGIQISFQKFLEKENILMARSIFIVDIQKHTTINIKIDKFQLPWDGKVEFIPGNRYELVQLL
jgi:hypothetical protein